MLLYSHKYQKKEDNPYLSHFIFQDGHEICFVGDKGFRDLSAFDPEADKELQKFIKKDAERKK